MKKTLLALMLASATAIAASAASPVSYKVYDVVFNLKAAKAGKIAENDCGEYAWRDKSSKRIRGVITGCGCEAGLADADCSNFKTYFWDEQTKTQITNFMFNIELAQRIGKKFASVEQCGVFACDDFYLMFAGFGKYTDSKYGSDYDTMSVSGNAVGVFDAPKVAVAGSCCGDDGQEIPTIAIATCAEIDDCDVSEKSGDSPAYGTYTFKPNSSKASRCAKKGVTAANLGLPKYVDFAKDNSLPVIR